MHPRVQFVVFSLDGFLYALDLNQVHRVVPCVESTPLPQAPAIVLGAIDLAGEIIPALDLRLRFGLPPRPLRAEDQFIIAQTALRTVALLVDSVEGVVDWPASGVVDSGRLLPGLDQVEGIITLEEGLVLIHDLERLLSLEEERGLQHALPWTPVWRKRSVPT